MTTTLSRPVPRTAAQAPTTGAPDLLLDVLTDALAAVEDADLDRLHARTAPGAALLTLAAIARRAVAELGGEPGTDLSSGPGVVVVRDVASATRLLARTAAAAPAAGGARLGDLPARAKGVHAALRESMTAKP